MRKLIAGLLALTALSPMALPTVASAQDTPDRGERWQRGGRGELRADVAIDGRDDPRSEPEARRPRPDPAPRDDGRRFDRGGDRQRDRGDQAGNRGWQGRTDSGVRPDRDGRADGGPRPGWQQRRDADGPRAGGWQRPEQRRDTVQHRDRARDDWARSRFDDRGGRFDTRDDYWTRSRFADRAQWNRGWRSDGRYDWNRYRATNRSAFHLPRYYAPGGWGGGYRRFQIGVGLQASLWDRNYWIDDPYAYRLPEAYGPYRWVRYYDDALLVDARTGVVVDAAYGIFW